MATQAAHNVHAGCMLVKRALDTLLSRVEAVSKQQSTM